jgi:LacI family transcriptional regulator
MARPTPTPDDPPPRVTMTHVAERVGVSVATVSYVMNDRPGVGDEVRARVLEAADELGFRPNRLAQGLRRGRTKLLGLLLADIANPFYPELAAGVIDGANELGYQVFLSQTGNHGEFTEREARALLDLRCDALIFTSVTTADRPLLTQLLTEGVAFVQTVRRVEDLPADFVGIDDRAGGRDLIEHLLALGHRDIAFLHGPVASSASSDRLDGCLTTLAAAGLRPDDERVIEVGLTLGGGFAGAGELLASGRPMPSAIVCGNDVIALGAIDALMDAGVRVPEDVAVVGYDDMPFASSRPVDLTTVHQPLRRMGAASVELLVERLDAPDLPPRQLVLPHHLVARSSSGTPAAEREPHRPRSDLRAVARPVGEARPGGAAPAVEVSP